MFHLGFVLLVGMAIQLIPQFGTVRVLEGKLIDADSKDNIVTMMTQEGTLQQLHFDETSRAFTSARTLITFQNSALQRGTRIRVWFDTANQVITDLTCVPETASKPK